jgi:hypothetical protein
MFVGVYYIA